MASDLRKRPGAKAAPALAAQASCHYPCCITWWGHIVANGKIGIDRTGHTLPCFRPKRSPTLRPMLGPLISHHRLFYTCAPRALLSHLLLSTRCSASEKHTHLVAGSQSPCAVLTVSKNVYLHPLTFSHLHADSHPIPSHQLAKEIIPPTDPVCEQHMHVYSPYSYILRLESHPHQSLSASVGTGSPRHPPYPRKAAAFRD